MNMHLKVIAFVLMAATIVLLTRVGEASETPGYVSGVFVETDGLVGQIYVNGFVEDVTPSTLQLRQGDVIRIADRASLIGGMVFTLDYKISHRHLSDYEEYQYTLVYPYNKEKELKFRNDFTNSIWYKKSKDGETPVGIELSYNKNPVEALNKVLAQKPEYLWVKLEAAQVPAVASLLQSVPNVGIYIRHADEPSLNAISSMKNVSILNVASPNMNHGKDFTQLASISALSEMTWLRSLNLEGLPNLKDLSPLEKLTELNHLDLVLIPTDLNLSVLSKLKNLVSLSLPMNTTDEQLDAVCSEHLNLINLNLQYCKALTTLKPLEKLSQLQGLCLEHNTQLKDIQSLPRLTSLRALNISRINSRNSVKEVGAVLAAVCKENPNIERLGITFIPIGDISPVANLQKLRWFSLFKGKGHPLDVSPIANLKSLKHLNFKEQRVKTLDPLVGLTDLRSVVLMRQDRITDISPMAELKKLRYLNLMMCKSLEDITPIAGLTDIRFLQLRQTKITSLKALSELKNLTI